MHSVLNVPYKKNGTKQELMPLHIAILLCFLPRNDKISVIKIRIGKLSFFNHDLLYLNVYITSVRVALSLPRRTSFYQLSRYTTYYTIWRTAFCHH